MILAFRFVIKQQSNAKKEYFRCLFIHLIGIRLLFVSRDKIDSILQVITPFSHPSNSTC